MQGTVRRAHRPFGCAGFASEDGADARSAWPLVGWHGICGGGTRSPAPDFLPRGVRGALMRTTVYMRDVNFIYEMPSTRAAPGIVQLRDPWNGVVPSGGWEQIARKALIRGTYTPSAEVARIGAGPTAPDRYKTRLMN